MPEQTLTPESIGRWMIQQDHFARQLGIELESITAGGCRVGLTVSSEMLNAVGLTHGGVTFTLADVAFALASNSHGRVALALSAQISYPAASQIGDRLTAVAVEKSLSGRTALYSIEVTNDRGSLVGLFNGTVYRRAEQLTDWIQGEKK